MISFKEHIEERAKQSKQSNQNKLNRKVVKDSSQKKVKGKKINIKSIMKKLAVGAGAGIVGGIAFKNFLKKNADLIGDISIEFLKK